MKIEILSIKGEKTGKSVTLPESIFGIEPNKHAVYLAIKQYLANQRQGTHDSLEKSTISGSTRKLKKQKGTGTARAGSIKNPLFKGGARVFGPHPRDYSQRLNKKVKELARKSALSAKATDGKIVIVEDFTLEKPKTKELVGILSSLQLNGKKSILVLENQDNALYLSGRNLPKHDVCAVKDLNTYQIVNAENLIFSVSAVNSLS